MADREKVAEELLAIKAYFAGQAIEAKEEIIKEVFVEAQQTIENAIFMLKEQEAREQCLKTKCVICPHCYHCDVDENGQLKEQEAIKRTCRTGNNGFSIIWTCGACGSDLHPNNAKAKYCSNCGRAVKWK